MAGRFAAAGWFAWMEGWEVLHVTSWSCTVCPSFAVMGEGGRAPGPYGTLTPDR